MPWRKYPTSDVVEALKSAPDYVGRVCISMITHPQCLPDVLTVSRRVAVETGFPVSLLISPTLLDKDDLLAVKDAGADRVGVAIDAATPEIFERLRGKPVKGPHRWEKYWRIYEQSLEVFGQGMSGVHLICGLGETEKEMAQTMSRVRAMGGSTHLFSFFPEEGSAMEGHLPPPMGTYRRTQLARWLMDNDRTRYEQMSFDSEGRITEFGVSDIEVRRSILAGEAFETSGCPGPNGKVACNRPYGNEKPGGEIRNFPFPPHKEDIERIIEEIKQ